MVLLFIYSLFISAISVVSYRYSFPYPRKEYLGIFILLFFVGFILHLYQRNWGRVWIVVSSLTLVRIGAWGGILTTIPDWTTLHPLFLGGIWAILLKEKFKFASKPGKDRLLSASVHFVFIFFLLVLGWERFLEYHTWEYFRGDLFADRYYFEGFSARQGFQLTWMILDNIVPCLSYFVLDEIFKRDTESPVKDYRQGLIIVFIIQALVLFIQNFLSPGAFMQNTGMSLDAGRSAGLFKDSGSASWIFPSIGIYLLVYLGSKKGQMLEKVRLFFYSGVYILTLVSGIYLGRIFWVIWGLFSLYLLYSLISSYLPRLGKPLDVFTRMGVGIFISAIFYAGLWFGDNQKSIPSLQRASVEWKQYWQDPRLERIDPNRVGLFLSSLQLFRENLFFGNGLGSLIVELKSPQSNLENKPPLGFIDSPSNFFIGWLGDTGILGGLILTFYLAIQGYIRKDRRLYLLLILPLMTGFQLVHSDGAFFVLLVLFGIVGLDRGQWRTLPYADMLRKIWFILGTGITLHFLVRSLLKNS